MRPEPDLSVVVFRRIGWSASHDASVRGRIKQHADQLPHESDMGVLDSLAKSIADTEEKP